MIETRHLILRPWEETEADARQLYLYASDPAIGPAAGWPPHKSIAESRQILHRILCTPEIYAVLPKQTGRPGGCAGLTFGKTGRAWLKERETEAGYWIGRPFQGRGYASEALDKLIERAFTVLNMRTVWAGYYEGNDASRRVQEKCHMTWHHVEEHTWCELLGEYRDEHFMRITRKEWMRLGRGRV